MSEFFRKPIVKTLMLKGEKGDTGDSDYQPAVDALGKRIDNLILSSGTESSAEVVDARTGYDGTAHDTLGTAIRSQISELKSDIDDQYDSIINNINYFKGLAIGTIFNKTQTFNPNFKYRVANKSPYNFPFDIIIYNVKVGYKFNIRILKDADNNTWSDSPWIKTGENFIVPKNSIFNMIIARVEEDTTEVLTNSEFKEFSVSVYYERVNHTVTNLTNKTDVIYNMIGNEYVKTVDGYLDGNASLFTGVVGISQNYEKCTDYINVESDKTISLLYATIASEAWYRYAFYDTNYNVVQVNSQHGYDEKVGDYYVRLLTLSVPSNAAYFRFSCRTFNDYKLYISKNDNLFSYNNIINQLFIKVHNNIRKVAHQGFSTTDQYHGNSRISSYIGAYINGFDFGECDLKWSADNVPVCCHDETFLDNGTTITIGNNTVEELKKHSYYGETIATFDEVLKTCKEYGLGLYIDQLEMWNDEKWNTLFSIVKKYAMENRVVWLSANPSIIQKIQMWYKPSQIALVCSSITENIKTLAVNTKNDFNAVSIDVNYSNITIEELIALNVELPPGITIEVWTIDNAEVYNNYLPYVSAITSNKLS